MRSLFSSRWLMLLAALVMLAGCGGPGGYSQTLETASYRVQLSLDGTNFDAHTATIEVRDKSNQPVSDAQVVAAALMESMGMAAPEQTAQPLGSGRYQTKGEFFSMIGEWEFDVRITAGGRPEEIARFKVPVQE